MNEENITFKFNEVNEKSTRRSILEAQAQRRTDAKDLNKDILNVKNKLDDEIAKLDEILKLNGKLDTVQEKRYQKYLGYQTKFNALMSEGSAEYEKSLELTSDAVKDIIRNNEKILEQKLALAKSDEEKKAIQEEINELEGVYGTILDDNTRRLQTHKKAQESVLKGISEKVRDFKNSLAQITTIVGLDKIYNSLSGNGGQIATYNNLRSQFTMSKSDFDSFKRDIFTQVKNNGDLLKYGFQDALDYMNRLGELGITDQQIAKEQMDAILLSTKYLGMSADTQTKIFRQARNTGNMDLLNQTNKTMVQIMNAQLGVSKDQLDAIVNQSVDLADMAAMFSGNVNALDNFSKSASALESVYGESAAKATMDIAADLLANPGESRYIPVLGGNYNDIVNKLMSGDGSALYDILYSVQNSRVSGAGATNPYVWGSISGSGYLDRNTMALYNARAQDGKSYGTAMQDIASASNDTNKFLSDMRVDWKTALENLTSWVNAFLPLSVLQTTYYTMAIADMALGGISSLIDVVDAFKLDSIKSLKDLIKVAVDGKSVLGNANSMGGVAGKGIAGSLKYIGGALIALPGLIMGISDGVEAISKKEEWGTSGTASFLGGFLGGVDTDESVNFLKNTMKWALIGAGVGMMVGHPIIGGLLGALFGGVMGSIGGKSIAEFLDGGSEAVGTAQAPITSLSYGRGSPGMGEAISSNNFPWYLSSRFGYRGAIQTKAGTTNPFHNGIDLANAEGTPIGANNSGIVSAVGTSNDGANYVIINSGDGYEQLYWHLMQPSHLRTGMAINAGQMVGYMGQTGRATGPHLHYGLRHAGTQNYIDPINTINSELFYPTDAGVPNMGVLFPGMAESGIDSNRSTTILSRMIDADTLSNQVAAVAYDGIGSSDVVDAVNGGFAGLIDKIDSMSKRQDEQEAVLQMIAQGKGSNIFRY